MPVQDAAATLTTLTEGACAEDEVLGTNLTALSGARDATARQAAALALATQYRAEMVDQEQLQAYLGRTDVPDAEKTATLGQLSIEKARAEYLLGTAHKGGGGSWESPANRGAFPDHYQDTVQTHGRGDGAYWCTSFAGTMQAELGFQFSSEGAASEARSPFWSGYRFDRWARTGQSNGGAQLTPEAQALANGAGGSVHVSGAAFGQLRTALAAARTPETRQEALRTWLGSHAAPQAGDIIVLDAGNAISGGSHTVMVERFDATTGVISTIEGNASNRVDSRRIDLTDAEDVSSLASLGRVGASHFAGYQQGTAPPPGAAPATQVPGSLVTGESLLSHARCMVQRLFDVVKASGWVAHGTADDASHTWMHGDGDAGAISTQ